MPLFGALLIALVGFWLALRQDGVRWSRERRAELSIDLMAEATAEENWLQHELTLLETDGEHGIRLPDTRLPPRERALLGAHGLAFASRDVIRMFKTIGPHAWPVTVSQQTASALKIEARLAFDDLEQQVRRELRSD